MSIDFKSLAEPFPTTELEWRVQAAGEKGGRIWAKCVPYVTNRAIQQRLDDVVGPANWRNEFSPGPDGGVLCCLSVKVDGEWVSKCDGAENTDVEGVKGGLSAAMKRAAVLWGIGRYLYSLDEAFATVHDGGRYRGKTREGTAFKWDPPSLPNWAQPSPVVNVAPDHSAMVDYLRAVGPKVDDSAEVTINRQKRKLREYVRESWPAIKDQHGLAQHVTRAVEQATSVSFSAFVETGDTGNA